MTNKDIDQSLNILWKGRPWIVPAVAVRSVVTIIVLIVLSWVESMLEVAWHPIFGVHTILWTYIVMLLIWFIAIFPHLFQRATNMYILRQNSLEVETGIVSKKSIILSATGFSDLELLRFISGRILNVGGIIVRSDAGLEVRMRGVRNPVKVSNMIRDVMTKPVVKMNREV